MSDAFRQIAITLLFFALILLGLALTAVAGVMLLAHFVEG